MYNAADDEAVSKTTTVENEEASTATQQADASDPLTDSEYQLQNEYEGYANAVDDYEPTADDIELKEILDDLTDDLAIIVSAVHGVTLPDPNVSYDEVIKVNFPSDGQSGSNPQEFYPLQDYPFSNYDEIKAFITDTFSEKISPFYLNNFVKCEVISENSDGTLDIQPVDQDGEVSDPPLYIELDGRLMVNAGVGGSGVSVATSFTPVHVTLKTDTRIEFSYIMSNPIGENKKVYSVKGAVVKENDKWKLDWNATNFDAEYTNFLENWGSVGTLSDSTY